MYAIDCLLERVEQLELAAMVELEQLGSVEWEHDSRYIEGEAEGAFWQFAEDLYPEWVLALE